MFGNGWIAPSGGSKRGIHEAPVASVKEDNIVDPALLVGVYAYPGMVGVVGVADDQLGRNILEPQHSHHKSRVVEADAVAGSERVIYIRKISALNRGGFVVVVGQVIYRVQIDGRYLLERIRR